jgi:hypothetical protein
MVKIHFSLVFQLFESHSLFIGLSVGLSALRCLIMSLEGKLSSVIRWCLSHIFLNALILVVTIISFILICWQIRLEPFRYWGLNLCNPNINIFSFRMVYWQTRCIKRDITLVRTRLCSCLRFPLQLFRVGFQIITILHINMMSRNQVS